MKKGRWFRWILLIPLLLVVACSFYYVLTVVTNRIRSQVAAKAEATLAATYGAEIQATIANYEAKWMSLEAYYDPSVQAALAKGPYLEYWKLARLGPQLNEGGPWLVTKSAVVNYIRVLEYTPEQFKALASVIRQIDEYTPKGEFTRSYQPREVCRLYLFVREDSVWKVADLFDMTRQSDIARDWENFVAWEKDTFGQQIMGDLPLTDCSGYTIP